jgi:ribosomal protein S18 acetylase RimI-like enzyme
LQRGGNKFASRSAECHLCIRKSAALITVRLATTQDIEAVAPLFDAYRQFYGQAPNLDLARRFLQERCSGNESTLLLAEQGSTPAGFTQLYPSFSSTRAARIYILNDLYVAPSHRRLGVGQLLLREAARYALEKGAIRLTLSTAHTNLAAQRLYESLGWKLDEQFRTYTLATGA